MTFIGFKYGNLGTNNRLVGKISLEQKASESPRITAQRSPPERDGVLDVSGNY